MEQMFTFSISFREEDKAETKDTNFEARQF
jgi:hypothetical protein